jgi:hypothetical protein
VEMLSKWVKTWKLEIVAAAKPKPVKIPVQEDVLCYRPLTLLESKEEKMMQLFKVLCTIN